MICCAIHTRRVSRYVSFCIWRLFRNRNSVFCILLDIKGLASGWWEKMPAGSCLSAWMIAGCEKRSLLFATSFSLFFRKVISLPISFSVSFIGLDACASYFAWLFLSKFYFVYDVLQWIGLLGGSSEKVLFILVSVLMFDRLCFALCSIGRFFCLALSRASI